MTTKDEMIELLRMAQDGDQISEETLLNKIRTEYMNKRIGRYLDRNRQAENDDLKQEFMIGVALSIKKASLDIGDPIEFLVAQGVYHVRTYLRSKIITNTAQVCMDCGCVSRLNRINGMYICKRCGSSNIETHEVHDHDDIIIDNAEDTAVPVDEQIVSQIMIEEFEKTLVDGTNVKKLYILLKQGINRDNPNIKNYIKEIAKIWGGCSEQNVVQVLEKLQNRIIKFADECGYEIVDNKFVEKG